MSENLFMSSRIYKTLLRRAKFFLQSLEEVYHDKFSITTSWQVFLGSYEEDFKPKEFSERKVILNLFANSKNVSQDLKPVYKAWNFFEGLKTSLRNLKHLLSLHGVLKLT